MTRYFGPRKLTQEHFLVYLVGCLERIPQIHVNGQVCVFIKRERAACKEGFKVVPQPPETSQGMDYLV